MFIDIIRYPARPRELERLLYLQTAPGVIVYFIVSIFNVQMKRSLDGREIAHRAFLTTL